MDEHEVRRIGNIPGEELTAGDETLPDEQDEGDTDTMQRKLSTGAEDGYSYRGRSCRGLRAGWHGGMTVDVLEEASHRASSGA